MATCVKVVKTEMIIVNKYHMPLLKSNSRNIRENEKKSRKVRGTREHRGNSGKPGETRVNSCKPGKLEGTRENLIKLLNRTF